VLGNQPIDWLVPSYHKWEDENMRVGTWDVMGHVNFNEKPDERKKMAVYRVLSGSFDLKEVLKEYPQLGIEINGKPLKGDDIQ
jgi:hypothetical protein